MANELFKEWVRNLDRQFDNQERKIAVLIDNCPAHPRVENLTNVNLIFFYLRTLPLCYS